MVTAVSSKAIRLFACGLLATLLAACGGKKDDPVVGGTTYSIGGSVSGLTGTLVLQNNGGNNLTVSANGNFTFTTQVSSGGAYNVTILTQPSGQTCGWGNASGTATANVTNVVIVCSNQYTLGGTVSGLNGTLVLVETNEEDTVVVSAAGSFTFPMKVTVGFPYGVAVYKQPLGQTCTVTGGATGTPVGNITNVTVNCVANPFTVSGTVSGLTSGSMVLQLNLGDNITVGNGGFTFPKPLAAGTPYVVSVVPNSLIGHSCTFVSPAGTANANVTNVGINCTPLPANGSIGGTVSGLTGTVVLSNSVNAETVSRSANGSFTFPTAVTMNSTYVVSVQTQPAGQTCTVFNGTGNVAPFTATALAVNCTTGTETHTIGGTVTGLKAPLKLLATLSNAVLDVNAAGGAPVNFTFPVPLPFGAEFQVVPIVQPTGQTCMIPHSGSHMGHANITDLAVTCVDNATDALIGTYTSYGGGFAVTFYGGGIYVFGEADDDPSCGGTTPGKGVEMGAYNYNAATGALAFIANVIDTDGPNCGVWQNGASIINGSVVKTGVGQGAVLKLTPKPGEDPVALVPVPSVPNLPTGSFFVPGNFSFAVFGEDGRYLEVNANNDPASNAPAGVEYGCYTRAGVNTGTITPTLTLNCPDSVDTDNTAGLSGAAGTPLSYTAGPGFLILDNQVAIRIVPN